MGNGFTLKNDLKLHTLSNTETGTTSVTNRCNNTSAVTVLAHSWSTQSPASGISLYMLNFVVQMFLFCFSNACNTGIAQCCQR